MNLNLSIYPTKVGDNPFEEHPQLKGIWATPKSELAAQCAREDAGSGEIFLIEFQGRVVGITGFFVDTMNPDTDLLYLRWTGVIESVRRKGITSYVLDLLRPYCERYYPNRNILVEMVPNTPHGIQNVAPFFEHYGFVKYGEPYKVDWADHEVQDYRLWLTNPITTRDCK